MKLLMMQPVWIPNLHDFTRLMWLDGDGSRGVLMLTDHQQWSRKGRTHRAQIRTPEGTTWLNLPLRKEDRNKAVRDVRLDHSEDWIRPVLRTIEFNYRNSVYFDHYEPEIRADLERARGYEFLAEFSAYMWARLFTYLEYRPAYQKVNAAEVENRWFSGESLPGNPDEVADFLGADTYLQEWGSKHYIRQGVAAGEIEVNVPEYRQHFEGFEPDVCVLDLLFQMGPESFLWMDKVRDQYRIRGVA